MNLSNHPDNNGLTEDSSGLIGRLLQRQDEVLQDLDDLNDRIERFISELSQVRNQVDAEQTIPLPPTQSVPSILDQNENQKPPQAA